METKFIESKKEAGNAVSYFFELPTPDYSWIPGQYISLSLKDGEESHDYKHWFTISSNPALKKIQITTRQTGSLYKDKLLNLKEGDAVFVSAPEGDFTWKDTDKPVVLVAGGIGITPFHSMLSSNYGLKASLIYVNRDADYVYKNELEDITSNNPNLQITYLEGTLSAEVLSSANKDIYSSLVYLSGPEPMVEALGNSLIENGLPENNLIRDWFPGYDDKTF